MIIKKILITWLLLCSTTAYALPTAKMTLKVIDEAGKPIEGAEAWVAFRKPKGYELGSEITAESELTDADGLFTASSATEPFLDYGAFKDGYYRTDHEYSFNYNESGMIGFRKWQPWNPTVEVVLKKKIKPIPLYAVTQGVNNEHYLMLPGTDQYYGYDLIARDWVVPYGQGTHKDFLFKLDVHQYVSWNEYDATLTLKFSNPGDGLVSVFDKPDDGSELRLPHHAPLSGYQPELVQRVFRTATQINQPYHDDQNYFYRVRTEMDAKGNVTSALYGKVHGDIRFGVKPPKISLIYYLNPKSNDTNLEFDIGKNLFQNLPPNMGRAEP